MVSLPMPLVPKWKNQLERWEDRDIQPLPPVTKMTLPHMSGSFVSGHHGVYMALEYIDMIYMRDS